MPDKNPTAPNPSAASDLVDAVDRLCDARRGLGLLMQACACDEDLGGAQLHWALGHIAAELEQAVGIVAAEIEGRRAPIGADLDHVIRLGEG